MTNYTPENLTELLDRVDKDVFTKLEQAEGESDLLRELTETVASQRAFEIISDLAIYAQKVASDDTFSAQRTRFVDITNRILSEACDPCKMNRIKSIAIFDRMSVIPEIQIPPDFLPRETPVPTA